jgi:hypothetical protein
VVPGATVSTLGVNWKLLTLTVAFSATGAVVAPDRLVTAGRIADETAAAISNIEIEQILMSLRMVFLLHYGLSH